ncbi:hypothetical protein NLI96_g10200 [Meripilus lineatus]|uniref:SUN domain-containing protein n=1 Tax=Meripilus lineatus TaxID=2056292 RepID=A0AAD5UZ97_9APHY|nr:hypothetical protein NLI96_g10200 [Physisporinus lineatus]
MLDAIALEPIRRVGNFIDSDGFAQMGKYAGLAFVVWLAWAVLNSGYLRVTVHRTSDAVGSISDLPHTVYVPPDAAPADLTELSDRLQKMEGALKALSLATERSRMHIEGNIRQNAEMSGMVGALEEAVRKEEKKAKDIESRLGKATKEGLSDLKGDLILLKARFDAQVQAARQEEAQAKPRYGGRGPAADEEARAKLRALEERVGSTEAGVKEALELGRNSATIAVGAAAGGAGSVSAWWNKLASGKPNGITIKSSDGQDLTNIISNMVDSAVAKTTKDDLAKPDYAMYSGGASVIPSLTSNTFEVRPASFVGRVIAGVTGSGHAVGRPPVTALHHELHIGYCWPFEGSKGQLGVKLAFPTVITEVTIDHIPRELATDPRSAPREMQLWGMLEGEDNVRKYTDWVWEKRGPIVVERVMKEVHGTIYMDDGDDEDDGPVHEDDFVGYPATLPRNPVYVKISEFVYNVHEERAVQTFPVREEIKKLGLDFGVVVLVVESNWGKEESTCLVSVEGAWGEVGWDSGAAWGGVCGEGGEGCGGSDVRVVKDVGVSSSSIRVAQDFLWIPLSLAHDNQ